MLLDLRASQCWEPNHDPIFHLFGVTTAKSSIMRIFPQWRDLLQLGSDIEVQGRDLPMHAPARSYREVVEEIKNDPNHLGGLVTTHKLDLYHATADLFAGVTAMPPLRRGLLHCEARRQAPWLGQDPISAGKSLDSILKGDYFARTGGHVLCFGAGGSGVAISLYLMTRPNPGDRPKKMVITNRSPGRLDSLQALHHKVDSDVEFEYVQSADPAKNDALMEQLPPGSLVINATGMGKDSPGSPVSDQGAFLSRASRGRLTIAANSNSCIKLGDNARLERCVSRTAGSTSFMGGPA